MSFLVIQSIVVSLLLSPISGANSWKATKLFELMGSPRFNVKFLEGDSPKVERNLLNLFLSSDGWVQDLRGTCFLVDSTGVHPLATVLFQGFTQKQVRMNISLEDEEHTPLWVFLRFMAQAKASSDPNKETTVFILSRPKRVLNHYSQEFGK
jgi:hypothetical protein